MTSFNSFHVVLLMTPTRVSHAPDHATPSCHLLHPAAVRTHLKTTCQLVSLGKRDTCHRFHIALPDRRDGCREFFRAERCHEELVHHPNQPGSSCLPRLLRGSLAAFPGRNRVSKPAFGGSVLTVGVRSERLGSWTEAPEGVKKPQTKL